MSPHRKTSLAAGVLYLLTFVSIPTLALYGSVKGTKLQAKPWWLGANIGACADQLLPRNCDLHVLG